MSGRPPAQAEELVAVALEAGELFHDGDIPYADLEAGEPVTHHEVLPLRSRSFRTWLSGRFWGAAARPAGAKAVAEAIDVLAALARFEGSDRRVGLRIAEHAGAIYLDLGDSRWRVVEIDLAGWRILDR